MVPMNVVERMFRFLSMPDNRAGSPCVPGNNFLIQKKFLRFLAEHFTRLLKPSLTAALLRCTMKWATLRCSSEL